MLLQIARQSDPDAMHELVNRISGDGITRDEARRFNKGEAATGRRPRKYTFRFQPEDSSFRFAMTFDKPKVERHEVIERIKQILQRLLEEELTERAMAEQPAGTESPSAGGASVIVEPPRPARTVDEVEH